VSGQWSIFVEHDIRTTISHCWLFGGGFNEGLHNLQLVCNDGTSGPGQAYE